MKADDLVLPNSREGVASLTQEQILKLTVEQIRSLPQDLRNGLTPEQISWFDLEQLQCISELENLTGTQLNAIGKHNLLSEKGMSKLTEEQVRKITPEHIMKLNPTQLKGLDKLKEAQANWFSAEQSEALIKRNERFNKKVAVIDKSVEEARAKRITTREEVRKLFEVAHDTAVGQMVKGSLDNAKKASVSRITISRMAEAVIKIKAIFNIKPSITQIGKIVVSDFHHPRSEKARIGVSFEKDFTPAQKAEAAAISKSLSSPLNTMGKAIQGSIATQIQDRIAMNYLGTMPDKELAKHISKNSKHIIGETILDHARDFIEVATNDFKFSSLARTNPSLHKAYEKEITKYCKKYGIQEPQQGVGRGK